MGKLTKRKLISIIIPAYNEESTLNKMSEELKIIFSQEDNYDFEVIIVENGSSDATYEVILNLNKIDQRFKSVCLTRNFDCDGGISAGLYYAKGDAAVIIYADLQDPPSLIHKFLRKWEEGYLNVYGITQKRQDNKSLRSISSKLFYWFSSKLSGGIIPKNVGDFRLVDRSIYQAINNMPERNRILRGLFAWTGAKSIGVEYNRQERFAGDSKSNTLYALRFAINTMLSFSYIPLYIATGFGIILSLLSFIALLSFSIKFIFFGVPFDGFGTLICLILLLFGFLFLMLGIVGKYVAMIFKEVKGRPNFIVTDKIGLN